MSEGGKLYSVTYPGIVRNSGKAIRNLGGLDRIRSDLAEGRPLELRAEPDNAYHRSSWSARQADKDNVLNIVLKCTRRRRKVSKVQDGQATTSYEDESTSATVIGLLEQQHQFKGFADFQYLPIRTTNEESGELLEIPEDMRESAFPSTMAGAMDWLEIGEATTDADVLKLLAPPLVFARSAVPSPYLLAKAVSHKDLTLRAKQGSSAGASCRKERKALSLYIQGTEPEFPKAPTAEAVAYTDDRVQVPSPTMRGSRGRGVAFENRGVHERMEALFTERPMWTRNAIAFHTGLADVVLKTLMSKFAFYISSGPWGRVWCRYGYDPRKDPAAVCFQTIMVSFKNHAFIKARCRLRLGPGGALVTGHGNANADHSEASFSYRPGEMPTYRQSFFAVMDIDLPVAREYVEPTAAARHMDMAHPTLGFLPAGAVELIRSAVTEDTKLLEERLRSAASPLAGEEIEFPELELDDSQDSQDSFAPDPDEEPDS